jgi:hypothetical protein
MHAERLQFLSSTSLMPSSAWRLLHRLAQGMAGQDSARASGG